MSDNKDLEKGHYEAALFDLDGVLIDTEGAYTAFWDDMARRHDKPSTFAHDIKGTTLTEILERNFPASMHQDIIDAVHDYEDNMAFVPFEGVMEFLNALDMLQIPMAIVTSSDDKKMESLKTRLPELTAHMAAIIDGSMVTHSKPHPEGYLKAAELLGKDPCHCIVFEDSIQGLQAARRAGSKVVGLATTNPKEKVEPLCDVMIMSWKEITPVELGFTDQSSTKKQ